MTVSSGWTSALAVLVASAALASVAAAVSSKNSTIHVSPRIGLGDLLPSEKEKLQKNGTSIVGLFIQAGINFAISIGLTITFCLLRPHNGAIYARLVKYLPEHKRPPKLPDSLFGWFLPIWHANDRDILHVSGTDALIFLRFLRLCRKMLGFMAVLGLGALMPFNYFGGDTSKINHDPSQFPIMALTLSNVINLNWLWAHVAITYIFTVIVFVYLFLENKHYIRVRQLYFKSPEYQDRVHSRTLMVTHLPKPLRTAPILQHYIAEHDDRYPIAETSIARNLGALPELIEKHTKMVVEMEQVLTKYLSQPNYKSAPRPRHTVDGQKVDSIDYYTQQIEDSQYQIQTLRNQAKDRRGTTLGFVSYHSAFHAHMALRRIRKRGLKPTQGVSTPPEIGFSPEPRDIIWKNVQLGRAALNSRKWAFRGVFTVFCLVGNIPIGILTALTSVDKIVVIFPDSAAFFAAHQKLVPIWQSVMTPILLALLLLLLPFFMRIMSRYQGITTHSGVERAVMKKYYMFQFISNVIFSTAISVLLAIIAANGRNLGKEIVALPLTLTNSLSSSAGFWTCYLSLKGASVLFELPQILAFIFINFKRTFSRKATTPRQLSEMSKPPSFDYAQLYSIQLFLFTITMLYSVYAPLILGFALINAVVTYLTYKHQIMYVYRTRIQTGGAMWPSISNRIVFALICFQLFTLYSLRVRFGAGNSGWSHPQVYAMFPLPVISVVYGVVSAFWVNGDTDYMRPTPETIEKAQLQAADNAAGVHGDDVETSDISEALLHPMMARALAVVTVPRSIEHLVRDVYKGNAIDTPKKEKYHHHHHQMSRLDDKLDMSFSYSGASTATSPLSNGRQHTRFQPSSAGSIRTMAASPAPSDYPRLAHPLQHQPPQPQPHPLHQHSRAPSSNSVASAADGRHLTTMGTNPTNVPEYEEAQSILPLGSGSEIGYSTVRSTYTSQAPSTVPPPHFQPVYMAQNALHIPNNVNTAANSVIHSRPEPTTSASFAPPSSAGSPPPLMHPRPVYLAHQQQHHQQHPASFANTFGRPDSPFAQRPASPFVQGRGTHSPQASTAATGQPQPRQRPQWD